MSDLLREIEEDLKQEKVQRAIRTYAPFVLGLAGALVLGVILRQSWHAWQNHQAEQAAQQWFAALSAQQNQQAPEAKNALAALQAGSHEGFATLARLQEAKMLAPTDPKEAMTALRPLLKQEDTALADLARLRIALLGAEDAATLLTEASAPGRPFAALAIWMHAGLQLQQNQPDQALTQLQQLSEDAAAPQAMRDQARQMLSALGHSPVAQTSSAPKAASPAPTTP